MGFFLLSNINDYILKNLGSQTFDGMEVNGYHHSSEYLLLCSTAERNSYSFGTSWERLNDDRVFIFGWIFPLICWVAGLIDSWRSSLFTLFLRTERSTDQVIKPVNLEALKRWVGHIPADVQQDMESIAPMLRKLGYNPNANPPDYGQPDPEVINNTKRVYLITEYDKQYDFIQCSSRIRVANYSVIRSICLSFIDTERRF